MTLKQMNSPHLVAQGPLPAHVTAHTLQREKNEQHSLLKDWASEGKRGLKFQVCPSLAEIWARPTNSLNLSFVFQETEVVSPIPQSGVKIKRQNQALDSQLSLRKLPVNLGSCRSRVTESQSDCDQSPHPERGLREGKEETEFRGRPSPA